VYTTLARDLDLLATFVFALVGARVAADRALDYGGIAFIATTAALAGGTLRNVFLGLRPIWLTNPLFIISVLLAVVITLVFRVVKPIGNFLLIMDTLGLAVASVSGTQFALSHGMSRYAAAILGLITAVSGGLLRDLLCQVEPVLLHRETIGTSSLIGSIAYVLLTYSSLSIGYISLIAGAILCLVRGLSIYFHINLPKLKKL
jgi:uncharacterized membrane protein YeiH